MKAFDTRRSRGSGHVIFSLILAAACLAGTEGCGGAEPPTQTRGMGGAGAGAGDAARRSPTPAENPGGDAAGGGDEAGAPPRPDRPRRVLTREDFGPDTRDPFASFIDLSVGQQVAESSPTLALRQREVQLSTYAFEDLRLIGIVMSGRGVQPRALFVSTDGKSKTVKQGEYFSRAEVLLANVNRDYVEIEVVDEELAKGLNLAAGETRAIYLKND